jgi:hypothetical protein
MVVSSDIPSAVDAPAAAPTPPAPTYGTGAEIASTLNNLNNTDYSSLVLARRLSSLQRQNPQISASLAVDVAAGLHDTQANTTDLSPNISTYAQPNALSVLAHNALSQSASLGPVMDQQAYQQNLKALGYLPPGYNPTGQIDQTYVNANYQYTSDISQQINQGKGRLLSATAGDALKLLGTTMPSGIWKTLVGMAHGIGKSFSNTAKDVWLGATNLPSVAFGGETGHDLNAKIKAATGRDFGIGAIGEDVANVLTIAALATGVGELTATAQGLGALSGVGADEGLTGMAKLAEIIKPVPGEAGAPSRALASLVSKFGGAEAKDSIVELSSKYGPKALGRSPLMQVVGRGYGALRWITLPQGVLSTFEPHSAVGAAAAKAKAPWWVDLPVMAGAFHPISPEGTPEGIVSTAKRLLGTSRVADAWSGRAEKLGGLPEMWTPGQYTQLAVGAYAKAILTDAEGDPAKYAGLGVRNAAVWNKAATSGGMVPEDHFQNEMARLVARVIDNPTDPVARRLDPEFMKEAAAWAEKNQHNILAHYMTLVNSGATRDAMNLTSMHEWKAFDEASRIADEVTRGLTPQLAAGATGPGQGQLFGLRPPPPPGDLPELRGDTPTGRVLAMRVDNPAYRENIQMLAHQWDVAVNGLRSPGEVGWIKPPDLAEQARLESEIVKLPGMVGLPKSEWPAQLAKAAVNAPQDLTEFLKDAPTNTAVAEVTDAEQLKALQAGQELAARPHRLGATPYQQVPGVARLGPLTDTEKALASQYQDWVASQRALGKPVVLPREVGAAAPSAPDFRPHVEEATKAGYRLVLGGHGVILPSDVGPMLMEAPKMSKAEYTLSSLGLSPTPVDGAALVHATQMTRANEYAAEIPGRWGGYGAGQRMMQSVFRAYGDQVGDRAALIGEGVTKTQRMVDRLARTIQTSQGPSLAFIRSVLEGDEWGLTPTESNMMGRALYAGMKDGAAAPGLVTKPQGMLNALHTVAAGMRVHGLPGIMDALKAFTLSDIPGLGKVLPDTHYGHLFDTPLKLMGALRFQLNPMFELRKLTKGEALAGEMEGLAPSFKPWAAMQKEDWMGRFGGAGGPVPAGGPALPGEGMLNEHFNLPTGYDVAPGGKLIDRYSQIFTRTQGQDVQAVTDIDRAFRQSGVFGYNAQHHGIYDVGRIWDKTYTAAIDAGKSADDATTIADTYAQAHGPKLYTFGGKSPLARSANFLFFPFSFETKVNAVAADYLTSDPMRLLLAHEMARRLQALDQAPPGQQSRFQQIVNRYAPVMADVAKLNPWAYGVSPGQFLGLYRPLAESLALPAESVANMLHPGLIPADKVTTFSNLVPKALPGIKAVSQFFKDLNSQTQVVVSPRHEANQGQINDYYPLKTGLASQYADIGRSFGTGGTIQEFMASSRVPVNYKQAYQTELVQLRAMYPAGAQHEALASNTAARHQYDIEAVLNKVHKTVPEKAITELEAVRLQMQGMYVLGQKSPVMKHLVQDTETHAIQANAVRIFQGMSRPNQIAFNALWIKLGYDAIYGTLAIPLEGGKNIGAA